MRCIFAFRDECGDWHGSPELISPKGDIEIQRMTYLPDRRSPGFASPFAGRKLEILCSSISGDLTGGIYESDDTEPLSATWEIYELLDDPTPPAWALRSAPKAAIKAPMFPGDPSLEIDVYDGSYEMDVWECGNSRFYVEVFGKDRQASPVALLKGEIPSHGLALIGQLFADAAQKSRVRQSGRADRNNEPWLGSDLARLEDLDDAGEDYQAIGMKLGRTAASIRWQLYKLDRAPFPSDLVYSRGRNDWWGYS